MPTLFPGALDDFTNPGPKTSQAAPRTHSQQHGDLNDAIEAVQAALGTTGAAGPMRSFLSAGIGAALRTIEAKLRESVTPEDFGAIGDGTDRPVSDWLTGGAQDRGYADLAAIQVDFPHVTALTDSLDWAAFQAAINYCKVSGDPLHCSGDYRMNRGLVIDSPINLDGGGVFSAGAGTTPDYISGARIQATSAVAHMILADSPILNAGLYGLRLNGLLLDANNLADKCLVASSLIRSSLTHISAMRAITVGYDLNDGNGTYFYKNWLNQLDYNATASVAAQNSDGFWFRDAGSLGLVQNRAGILTANVNDGDCFVIGGADNNVFGALMSFGAGATPRGVVFKGPSGFAGLLPRNNIIEYTSGGVVNETNSRTNLVMAMPSEGNAVTLTGAGGEVKFRAFNYVTGDYWSSPDYVMKDVRSYAPGELALFGSAAGTLAALWPTIDLADAATQGFGLSTLRPYNWRGGSIKAITLLLSMTTAAAADLRIRIRGEALAPGGGSGTPDLDESFTVTPNASANILHKVTLTLTAPMAITPSTGIAVRVDRIGGDALDTHTGVMQVLSVGLHYVATGPSSDGGGGGPWQVLDPTI